VSLASAPWDIPLAVLVSRKTVPNNEISSMSLTPQADQTGYRINCTPVPMSGARRRRGLETGNRHQSSASRARDLPAAR
jgi:hypothetical protein